MAAIDCVRLRAVMTMSAQAHYCRAGKSASLLRRTGTTRINMNNINALNI